jgi:hypothetical protein
MKSIFNKATATDARTKISGLNTNSVVSIRQRNIVNQASNIDVSENIGIRQLNPRRNGFPCCYVAHGSIRHTSSEAVISNVTFKILKIVKSEKHFSIELCAILTN